MSSLLETLKRLKAEESTLEPLRAPEGLLARAEAVEDYIVLENE